ncbi:NAD(P)/FAD-dependent oxidoreductase, partial [Nocardia tenerifensis]|uniref:NAD(P)/FAD-dependent oxidoreductase n=1 Tax=Nocardia tenerifensis TaxID=228006 RepID=UPI0006873E3F
MTGQHRIVVLGAGYAGLAAAGRLAKKARGAEITVVDASSRFVERVRLHQQAAGQQIPVWDLRELLTSKKIHFVCARATKIDTEGKRVLLDNAMPLAYDALVYALGSIGDSNGVPGVAEHAYSVSTPADVDRFQPPRGRIVVVGAGSTGIELAAELAESQPDSRILLLSPDEPGAWLSPKARAHIRRTLERLGVEIHSDAKVIEVTDDGVRLADGSLIEAAATVWTAGFAVPDLAARSGIAVDRTGRVLTDPALRSLSHPEIHAAGDSAVVAGPGGRRTSAWPARPRCRRASTRPTPSSRACAAADAGP